MNTCDGSRGNSYKIALLAVLGLTWACGNSVNRRFSDIPIQVSRPGSESVDVELVISNVQVEVEGVLPGAYLNFLSFVGNCANLADFNGQFTFYFVMSKETLLGSERKFLAQAEVDTAARELSIEVSDETSRYISLAPLNLTGIPIAEIAANLQRYLEATNRCDNTVVLQRIAADDAWAVRCGPPDKALLQCLRIDPLTGEVRIVNRQGVLMPVSSAGPGCRATSFPADHRFGLRRRFALPQRSAH